MRVGQRIRVIRIRHAESASYRVGMEGVVINISDSFTDVRFDNGLERETYPGELEYVSGPKDPVPTFSKNGLGMAIARAFYEAQTRLEKYLTPNQKEEALQEAVDSLKERR